MEVTKPKSVADNRRAVGEEREDERSEETGEKVFMLNVLWFKEDGGAETYAEYAAAAAPLVEELGGRLVESYTPQTALIGEWDPDLFFVVEWPNWDSFLKLPQNPEYQRIAHLREDALRDSLLIRCTREQIALPN